MRWHKTSITEGEIAALHEAAQRAWADDTRYPIASGSTADAGQCYVTSYWLKERLGGHIGRDRGHYAWLSPDCDYVLDLATHTGSYSYAQNENFKPITAIPNARTQRFSHRADAIFDHLGSLLHFSLDYMGDGLPAQEPQREAELGQESDQTKQYWHDEPSFQPAQGEYNFVFAAGQLEVSPFHDHEQLLAHTGVSKDHQGPMAMGHITLVNNRATWEVASNMNIKGLDRIFKDYGKKVGWDFGGITNAEGEPISDEFAPKASHMLNFIYDPTDDHLWIGRNTGSGLAARLASDSGEDALSFDLFGSGRLWIQGRCASLQCGSQITSQTIQSLYDFCEDEGLILYSGNDNVIKTIPDMEMFNNGNPDAIGQDHQFPQGPVDEREPSGVYQCPVCERLFPNWHTYADHRRDEANAAAEGEVQPEGGFPEPDMDATFPTHFTDMQPEVFNIAKISSPQPLPMDDYLYYRAHHTDAPFGVDHARSAPIEGADIPQEYMTPKEGYSAFWNPHHLREYMDQMGWDMEPRKIVAFRGTPWAGGVDGEPLVTPHSNQPEFELSWPEFEHRAEYTPNGYGQWGEHTWGEGPNGRLVDDGYRNLGEI